VVLSSTGNIQYQKYLDPWGNMEMEIGVPSSDIEFQYTDKEYDEDVMFYNFWRRYYDPYAGRFVGRDRVHLEDNLTKFFSINPYSYTRNNPLKYIDPDGKDYILLNDSKGAKGFGHNAALVGNDKEGWKYYSKEGYAIDNDIRSFKTLKSYGESDLAKRYDRQVQVKTTSEQDKVMKGFGDENYDKPYSLNEKEVFDKKTGTKEVISQNCADLTADIGNAGNVDMEKPSFMGFTYPNQQFDLLQQQTISTTK
jgi:RHS repeat-associated protein